MLTFNGVETSLLNLFVYGGVTLVKCNHEGGKDAMFVQTCYLFRGGRTAIQDPTVDLAVGFLKSGFHKIED